MCEDCFPDHAPPQMIHQKLDSELMNIINTFNATYTGIFSIPSYNDDFRRIVINFLI